MNNTIKVFTWHIHGSYLHYLSHAHAEFFVPVDGNRSEGYVGLPAGGFKWRKNLHELPIDIIRNQEFDVILFQNKKQYLEDQFTILSAEQRLLPKIYIEHDPPREHPVDTKHVVDDPHMLLVHVTHFNNLMWDSNRTPTVVIEHGVAIPNTRYTGKLKKGIVMVNNIASGTRGLRRMGYDIFEKVRQEIPLDIIGIGSKEIGGVGEIPHAELPTFLSQYRFLFNPIRYTSMGLSIIEAMLVGLPIVGLATTEMAVHITNKYDGFVHTNIEYLIQKMQELLDAPEKAYALGQNAKHTAREKFNINRFADDWEYFFRLMANHSNVVQKSLFRNIAFGGVV